MQRQEIVKSNSYYHAIIVYNKLLNKFKELPLNLFKTKLFSIVALATIKLFLYCKKFIDFSAHLFVLYFIMTWTHCNF